nr:hypothetical protein [Tanacetum cinerariifolium]
MALNNAQTKTSSSAFSLAPAPAVGADAQALADWAVLFYRHNKVAYLMLGAIVQKYKPQGKAKGKGKGKAIQGGRVQKYKPQGKAKGKGKEKGKGPQNSYPTKPKKPQPYKKERPTKDGQCHHYKEEGHWKRNCLVYLAELMKKKKKTGGQNVASTSSGNGVLLEVLT